jgi:hypothetical protein
MASGRHRASSHRKEPHEPGWWEWLEQQPIGRASGIAVLLGWAVLLWVYQSGIWSIDVVFFLAVGWLTLNLSLLSAFAAAVNWVHRHRARQPELFRLPDWLVDLEDYFRWLTPVIFMVGIIFGHYFWH